ncbi:MAG TPA: TPM domain-containing protein [Gemmataceae bacterium]|nr:TPM domain-containing protein [Gemmataceae bacterium]
MLSTSRWFLFAAVVLALLSAARPAAALTPAVRDNADFFSPAAVQKADDQIADIRRHHQTDLVIETFKTVPPKRSDEVKRMEAGARQRFFAAWANDRMKRNGIKDIYVLICRSPGHVQVAVGEHARRGFAKADEQKLSDLLLARFKANEKDKGLLEAVAYVQTALAKGPPPAGPGRIGGEVKDEGGFFTPDTVKRANARIGQINERFKQSVLVWTFKAVPADRAKEVGDSDDKAREKFFAGWLRELAGQSQLDAVSVLCCKKPSRVQVGVGPETAKKAFTIADRDRLSKLLLTRFRATEYDQGLLAGLDLVYETLDRNLAPPLPRPVAGAVKDYGGFFGPDTVKDAGAKLMAVQHDRGTPVVFETFTAPPPARAISSDGRDRFFRDWLRERAKAAGVDGIYVLVCKHPARVEVGVGEETKKKAFTDGNAAQLRKQLVEQFQHKHFDEGLAAATGYIADTLKANLAAAAAKPDATTVPPAEAPKLEPAPAKPKAAEGADSATGQQGTANAPGVGETTPPKTAGERVKEGAQGFQWTWLLWIALGLIGLWIVIGVLRALFRPRPQQWYGQPPGTQPGYGGGGQAQAGPQPGYGGQRPPPLPPGGGGYGGGYGPGGGGGYYGGGGGGGGGFFSGLLGGMFGAAAGNWVYDSMFRKSTPTPTSGGWGSSAHAAPPPRAEDQPMTPGDASGGAVSTTGGDFDDPSAGAGAVSSTGGDFGDDSAGQVESTGGDFGADAAPADAGTGGDFEDPSQNVADSTGGDFGTDTGGGGGDFGDTGASDAGGGDVGGGGDFGGGGGDTGGGDSGSGGGGGDF